MLRWYQSGYIQWWGQRLTAVLILLYVLAVVGGMFVFPWSLSLWQDYLLVPTMRILGTFSLLAVIVHAWIGLWIVMTDYLKAGCCRHAALVLLAGVSIIEMLWVLFIFWGYWIW